MADFAGKKLDKARDSQLANIQRAVLYAASALTNLWAKLIDQGLTNEAEATIHISDILALHTIVGNRKEINVLKNR